MVTAINNRQLINIPVGDLCLRGTYHVEQARAASSRGSGQPGRLGVLFVNSGGDPRSGAGNAATYWAESFAKSGHPSFRIDLPGLGDSAGELPEKWLDFFDLVHGGHYASFLSTAADHLVEEFGLSGIVIVGLCAGAVTAIYAASANPHVKGVVALAPYFYRKLEQRAALLSSMSLLATRNKFAKALSQIFGYVKKAALRVRGYQLPANANLPLLRCWRQLASSGMPILVMDVQSRRSKTGEFDYLRYIRSSAGRSHRIVEKFIHGAHHSFADNIGREAVRRYAEQWLSDLVPSTELEERPEPQQQTARSIPLSERLTLSHQPDERMSGRVSHG
jgi:pimeloyl-ACP methyl ester carboxylesterase